MHNSTRQLTIASLSLFLVLGVLRTIGPHVVDMIGGQAWVYPVIFLISLIFIGDLVIIGLSVQLIRQRQPAVLPLVLSIVLLLVLAASSMLPVRLLHL